jgi:hypothetical protein
MFCLYWATTIKRKQNKILKFHISSGMAILEFAKIASCGVHVASEVGDA